MINRRLWLGEIDLSENEPELESEPEEEFNENTVQ